MKKDYAQISVKRELWRRLKIRAAKEGKSLNQLIDELEKKL